MPRQEERIREFADSIAKTTKDYREDEIDAPTTDHVINWIAQFPENVRKNLLSGLDHVLKKTYLSKSAIKKFIAGAATSKPFAGDDPADFWRGANILDIQRGGNSQKDIRELLSNVLEEKFNFSIEDCGSTKGTFIYLDDVIFSGNRVVMDCRKWIAEHAPKKFSLKLLVAASHSAAEYYIQKQVRAIAADADKELKNLEIWRLKCLNNLSNDGARADVLRLRAYPDDDESTEYWENNGDGKAPALLRGDGENQSPFYSSEEQRNNLEQILWLAGVHIREECPHLKVMHRPLGFTTTGSANKLGFGSLLVSYRNCPNNSPLALWVGDPWYPLFPRRIN